MASTTTRLMTFKEFEQLHWPDSVRYELRHGELISLPPAKFGHMTFRRLCDDSWIKPPLVQARYSLNLAFVQRASVNIALLMQPMRRKSTWLGRIHRGISKDRLNLLSRFSRHLIPRLR